MKKYESMKNGLFFWRCVFGNWKFHSIETHRRWQKMKEFVIKITHGMKEIQNIGTRHAPSIGQKWNVYFICVDYFHKIIIIELFVIKLDRGNEKYINIVWKQIWTVVCVPDGCTPGAKIIPLQERHLSNTCFFTFDRQLLRLFTQCTAQPGCRWCQKQFQSNSALAVRPMVYVWYTRIAYDQRNPYEQLRTDTHVTRI